MDALPPVRSLDGQAQRSPRKGSAKVYRYAFVGVVVVMGLLATGGYCWIKSRVYVGDSKKVLAVATSICICRLPNTFRPDGAFDFWCIRGAMFTDDSSGNGRRLALVFDTTFVDKTGSMAQQIFMHIMTKHGKVRHIDSQDLTPLQAGNVTITRTEQIATYANDSHTMATYTASFVSEGRGVIVALLSRDLTEPTAEIQAVLDSVRPLSDGEGEPEGATPLDVY